jgi:uncharacterized protein YkwD
LYKALLMLVSVTGLMFADSLAVTPNSGEVVAGQNQNFTFTYSGALGGLTFAVTAPNGVGGSCYFSYVRSTNQAYLADDFATRWAYQGAVGSGAPIQNNQCAVDLAHSTVTGNATQATVIVALSFSKSFIGSRLLYINSWSAGSQIPWRQAGTISIVSSAANPAPTPAANNGLDIEEAAFLTLINTYRAQNGVGALRINDQLEASSRWMSNDMVSNNRFAHVDSLGRDPFTRMIAFGYPVNGTWAGENLAAGNSTAQGAFDQWLNACDADASGACTYGHRMNMLNGNYHVIGIARAYGASSTYRWYWTTDFGGS